MSRTEGGSKTAGTSARRTSANGARGRLRRRSRGGPLVALAKVAAAVVFAVVVAVGLLYVRLMHGPVALNALVHPIESGIGDELAGLRVSIESVALRLSESGLLQFELKNVRVSDAEGVPLVVAPSAAVSLSRRALLRGRIAVESLDLMSARLRLFYSDDGTLSLKFSPTVDAADSERTKPAALRGPIDTAAPVIPVSDADWTLGRIDLVKVLSEASGRARRQEHVSAYLREIGLRSATVIIDQGSRKSVWRVPEFDLDLDHRRSRSAIAGRARIESLAGPWELNFRSYEHINAKALNLTVSVQGLVPRGLARSFPQLTGLEGLDLPIWGDAQLELANTGEILSGKITVDVAPGKVSLPWLAATPMGIDSGHIALSYSGAARRFEVAPSVLARGDSRVHFTGAIVHASQGPDGPGWVFDLKSTEASIAAEPPALPRLPIDHLSARGFLAPERGRAVLHQFVLKAGGTEITAQGGVSDMSSAAKVHIDGKIGAMPVAVFKSLWPGWVTPGTRAWVTQRLARGHVEGGSFRIAYGSGGGEAAGDRVSLVLEGSNLEFALAEGWPMLEMPRGLLRLEGPAVEFAVPEASMTAADGRKLGLKGAFTVDLKEAMPRTGHIAVRGQGPLSMALEFLDQESLQAWQNAGVTLNGLEGKLEGSANISLPLTPKLQRHDARIEGKLRVSDGRIRQVHGQLDAQAINLVVDMTAGGAEATAEFLIKGVPAKASWQHVHGAPADQQPPLRITATLDGDQRAQLGLDINDLVQGDVGVEVTVASDARGERRVHLRADLANAEVVLESLAWHKPKGRPSTFECDFAKGGVYPTELRNAKLVGENVAIAGWMGAGADFRVREFRFPQFSLNVISVLEAHGKLRADNVWEVVAKGPTFDGRELFQSFFDINVVGDKANKLRPGLDLRAEVETVVGFYETNLRGVKLSMQKRAGKMAQLDARGTLAGNKQFEASVRQETGRPRLLLAKSNDAGQVFKLVGFYPHAVGGDMNLEVNLDGQGAAERTGTLTANRFHVLGDTVTVQNLPNPEAARPGERGGARRNVVRQRFEFDDLRAPFSIGHGQFVLHNAAIEGPLVSATMRGKVDFRTRLLQVGGTFTPLSTLNKLFSGVPLVGDIVTGPRREGVFAMTYALQGGLENPQLIVNPFSAITPGITRELMQIAPDDPRVVPRGKSGGGRNDGGPRSSSSPAAGPGGDGSATSAGPSIGGSWSADTGQPESKKR